MQPQKALTNLPQLRELPKSRGGRTSCLYQICHTDAFEWLKTAYQEHDLSLIGLRTDFTMDSLRSDLRYAEFVRKIGFPQ